MSEHSNHVKLALFLSQVQTRWFLRDLTKLIIIVGSWCSVSSLLYGVLNQEYAWLSLAIALLLGFLSVWEIFRSKLFHQNSKLQAALYIDQTCGTQERIVSALELLASDKSNAHLELLTAQIDKRIREDQKKEFLPPIEISNTLKVVALLGILALFGHHFRESPRIPEASLVAIEKIDALLLAEERTLPAEVKEVIEQLKESLQENELTSEEVSEAIEKAQSEIAEAQRELDTIDSKENGVGDSVVTPTPTPSPSPTPPSTKEQDRKDTDVQNSESSKKEEKGEKESKSEDENKDQDSKNQNSKDSKDGKSKEDQGSDSGENEGQSKDGKNEKDGDKGGEGSKDQPQSKDGKGDSKEQDANQESKGDKGEQDKDQKDSQGQEQGDKPQDKEGEGKEESKESKSLKAASQAMSAIKKEQQEQKNQGESKEGKEGNESKEEQKSPQSKDSKGSEGKGNDEKPGEKPGESESKKSEPSGKKPDSNPDPNAKEKPKGGSATEGQSDAKESAPGKGETTSPYGENKKFEETQIGQNDEKFDTQYTSKEGQRAKNSNEAQPKTKLSDVTVARPDIQREKSEQPIPLEYRDVLE